MTNIVITIIVSIITVLGFRYIRIAWFRFLFGPKQRKMGKVKVLRAKNSDKVYLISTKKSIKRWVHPRESLESIGYDAAEDVENITKEELDKYDEGNDIYLVM